MNWHTGTLVAFDTETTSLDPETARIVTAAIVTCDPVTGSVHTDEWLADPGTDIPAEATAIHGITTEMARAGGRPAVEVVTEIYGALCSAWRAGFPVIVYNAPFDLTLLDREMRRHTGDGIWHGITIDPLVLDKKHYRRFGKGMHQLGTACAIYGIDLSTQDAHGAAADALAAARLAWKIAKRFDLGALPIQQLHAQQIAWYAEQADEFAAYLRKVKLRTEGQAAADAVLVERDWPLRPVAMQGVPS